MNYQDYLNEAKQAALTLRPDILREYLEYGANLDDAIEEHVRHMADNLCIYTSDVRALVRALEDADVIGDYSELVCPEASRDEQNVSIAYEFWSIHIWQAVNDLFEVEGVEA